MKIFITSVLCIMPCVIYGADFEVPALSEQVSFFSDEPNFNRSETELLDLNSELQEREFDMRKSESGGVEFVFGGAIPTVICSPLRLCDIALERGELVKDLFVGDGRWKIQPAVSGVPPNHQVHAIIKPGDVGLETSLMIVTDRRVYNLNLKSSGDNYMPSISFDYPDSQTKKAWDSFVEEQDEEALRVSLVKAARLQENIDKQAAAYAAAAAAAPENQPQVTPRLGVDIDDLNFSYDLRGDFSWKPTRVFDDGIHTYVDLPNSALSGDVPVLLVTASEGNEIVNYRLKNNRYIVDGLVSKMTLLRGVGGRQQRVVIYRN